MGLEGGVGFRLSVIRESSRPRISPASVTARAVSFRWVGMVIRGVVIGGIFVERR